MKKEETQIKERELRYNKRLIILQMVVLCQARGENAFLYVPAELRSIKDILVLLEPRCCAGGQETFTPSLLTYLACLSLSRLNRMDEANSGAKKEGSSASPSSRREEVEKEVEKEEAAAATWTCAHCSLVNDEPDASFVQQGGVISCSVCLMVRGQEAWLCPSCNYMNTSLKAKACKVCASTAYGGRTSGSGRGDDIARDYKRRKRVHNKPRSSSSGGASASTSGDGGGGGGARSAEGQAPPSLKRAAATNVEVIRTEHSVIFGQQLKTMHLLVRGLQTFPAFRDAVAKVGADPTQL